MSVNLGVFENILNKFKFRQPVPASVQDYILASRDRVLRDTLKKLNRYSAFYGMTISVYFFLKKVGLGVGILASKAITAAALAVAGATMAVGTYTAARQYIIPRILHEKSAPVQVSLPGSAVGPISAESPKDRQAVTRFAVAVGSFSSSSVDRDMLSRAEEMIISELSRLKGDAVADIRADRQGKSFDYLLSGSIENLGRQNILTVKVFSVQNSKIIFVADETIDRPDDLSKACRSIAAKVAGKI